MIIRLDERRHALARYPINVEFSLETLIPRIIAYTEASLISAALITQGSNDMIAGTSLDVELLLLVSASLPNPYERISFDSSAKHSFQSLRCDYSFAKQKPLPQSCSTYNHASHHLRNPFPYASTSALQIQSAVRIMQPPNFHRVHSIREEMEAQLRMISSRYISLVTATLKLSEIMLPGLHLDVHAKFAIRTKPPIQYDASRWPSGFFPFPVTSCYPADLTQLWQALPDYSRHDSIVRWRLKKVVRRAQARAHRYIHLTRSR